jgi:hypothetical protein
MFIIYVLTVKDSLDESNSRTIIVDKPALLKFMQFRSKSFDEIRFEEKLNNMSDEEFDKIIDDYLQEEVLYREALALGLDREDYVIRRRLAQKVEFINQGFAEKAIDFSDDELKMYFEKNKDNYYIQPDATFTHVYFGNDVHGKEKAKVLAKQKLSELNSKNVPFTKSSEHGDRFIYNLNYVDNTPHFVTSHMGSEFTEELFSLTPSEEVWYGPIESQYGSHLVMLTKKEDGRYPYYEEVEERIANDANYEAVRERSEESIKEIVDTYDIRIVYDRTVNVEQKTRSESSEM